VLVEIIVIAAADNQSVAERVSKAALGDRNSLGYDFALALLTYQWRFSPATGDQFHSLYGQWALLAVLLVLTAFLVVLAARGGAGFARVFFMTWAVVIAATGLGAVTRAAVVDGRILQGASRFQFALFSDIGPSQYVFVAGLALGLVVAVAAGLTAVAVRRDEAVAAPADAVEPGPDQREDAPTTQIERAPSEPDPA
jgi:amino acid transporter